MGDGLMYRYPGAFLYSSTHYIVDNGNHNAIPKAWNYRHLV